MRLGILALVVLAGCGLEPDTPLTRASAAGDEAEVRRLLAAGSAADGRDSHGYTPLILAARNGRTGVLRALLAAGADPDLADAAVSGWTPLMHAVHKGQAGATRLLLEAGAEADHHGEDGVTALIMAAAYGNVDIVRMLLERGADPRARARGGITALSNAAGGGALFDITDGPPFGTCHVETVRALLERDPSLRLEGPVGGAMARWFRRGRPCEEVAALLARS